MNKELSFGEKRTVSFAAAVTLLLLCFRHITIQPFHKMGIHDQYITKKSEVMTLRYKTVK